MSPQTPHPHRQIPSLPCMSCNYLSKLHIAFLTCLQSSSVWSPPFTVMSKQNAQGFITPTREGHRISKYFESDLSLFTLPSLFTLRFLLIHLSNPFAISPLRAIILMLPHIVSRRGMHFPSFRKVPLIQSYFDNRVLLQI